VEVKVATKRERRKKRKRETKNSRVVVRERMPRRYVRGKVAHGNYIAAVFMGKQLT